MSFSRRSEHSHFTADSIHSNCLSGIEFDPPLSPLRQEAVQKGHVNLGSKIHFEVSNSILSWVAFCSPRSGSLLSSALTDHASNHNTYAVAFGHTESQLDLEDSPKVIAELKNLFPTDQSPDITAYLTHDWKNDPFAKGSWVAFAPGYMVKYQQELQKNHGSVYFASGDWSDGWRGFVDGAIASGAKAARRIIEKHRVETSGKTV